MLRLKPTSLKIIKQIIFIFFTIRQRHYIGKKNKIQQLKVGVHDICFAEYYNQKGEKYGRWLQGYCTSGCCRRYPV